jgi:hypothetical protein
MVTSDKYADSETSDSFFPTVTYGQKQAMVIPDITYHWTQWSVGATGVSWKSAQDSNLKAGFTLGYPSSRVSVEGQRGWFRYGAFSSAQFTDGTLARAGITLGPFTFEESRGLNERDLERSQTVSIGGPLFLGRKLPLTVIGKIGISNETSEYTTQSLKLNSALEAKEYNNVDFNLFAIYQINEATTWLNSGTFTFSDEALQEQVDDLKPVHFNIFSLISYSF